MKSISAKQLLKGLAAGGDTPVTAVVTDSRQISPGCVFVCFPGARVDGHDFAGKAWQSGAAWIVVNRPLPEIPAERQIVVPDSRSAMLQMASNYRDALNATLIGVTGSVGKTTTKEFCYAVLSAFGPTVKTQGNQNNEIGMPNTLFRMDDTTQYGVVEMGMNHAGEIHRLVSAARPQAGVITGIGVSHMENLGSRENICRAKLEICDGLPQGAPLVLNGDDALLNAASLPGHVKAVRFAIDYPDAEVRAVNIETNENGQRFEIIDTQNGRLKANVPAHGKHIVYDALAAYTAATRLGLNAARCAAALSGYQSTGMRQRVVHKKGVTIVEDCYNASPDSMRAALNMFVDIPAARRVALLGDMLELGAISGEAHQRVGEWAASGGIDLLVAYGPQSERMAGAASALGLKAVHCTNQADAARILADNLRPGDALLAKASRGMALEQVLALYYEEEL